MTLDLENRRLAILVHEVRSPVAAILAIGETLASSEVDAASRRELTRLALAACQAIERIVSDAAVASVRLEEVDPVRLLRDAAAAASLEGADVSTSIPAPLPPVEADPGRLRQAIDNLVANAVAHGHGRVVIAGAVVENTIRISVSDSGPGVAAADRERIFEPGVRVGASRRGEGLGLALSRAIAEAHGGALGVASSPEGGTTFTIELPRRARI